MPRPTAKIIPLDIRERQLLAGIRGGLGLGNAGPEARAKKFREECKRLAGILATVLRENNALRKTNECYADRIQVLEQKSP